MTGNLDSRSCGLCGAVIATDNHDWLCGPCTRKKAGSLTTPPVHPAQFWEQSAIRAALTSQHFGFFLKAYREAYSPTLKQSQVGEWIGLTQGQVSRIENSGSPVHDISKLTRWAESLQVPKHLLWFRTSYNSNTLDADRSRLGEEPRAREEGADLKRRDLLRITGIAVATAGSGLVSGLRVITERECAEKFAWELWQRQATAIHASELPLSVATYLGAVSSEGKMKSGTMRMSPEGLIIGDKDNYFSFAQPSLLDFYVGQHVFANVAAGHSHLLATAQTSHDTDLVLQNLVQRHEPSVGLLAKWMREGATPVLQVNSAGVLAKIGNMRLVDAVVNALKSSRETRQLYLTAVVNRVLDLSWDQAAKVAAEVETDSPVLSFSDDQVSRLAKEVGNPRDGAARWCGVVLLGQASAENSSIARTALHRALQEEQSSENLRSIGNVLIGNTAFTA